MKKTDERSPILVNNPYRDVLMNVEPLFYMISLYHPEEGYRIADDGVKIAALTTESEWITETERKEVITFLYQLKDFFSAMNECQISNPKKKGGNG